MKRYKVREFPCKGPFSSSLILYHQLKDSLCAKLGKGGIIVFPEDMMDVDTSIVKGKCEQTEILSGRFTAKDGTIYSGTSICIIAREYSSGWLMSLAMKYSRMYGKTVLLKDFEDRRLFSVHFNGETKNALLQVA